MVILEALKNAINFLKLNPKQKMVNSKIFQLKISIIHLPLLCILLHHIQFQIVDVELVVEHRIDLSMGIGWQRGSLGDGGCQSDEQSFLLLFCAGWNFPLSAGPQLLFVDIGQFQCVFDMFGAEILKWILKMIFLLNWNFLEKIYLKIPGISDRRLCHYFVYNSVKQKPILKGIIPF